MQLDLDGEQTELLLRIVRSYLSDLRMEIAGTEAPEWLRSGKHEEEVVRGIIAALERLDGPVP